MQFFILLRCWPSVLPFVGHVVCDIFSTTWDTISTVKDAQYSGEEIISKLRVISTVLVLVSRTFIC